MTTTVRLTPRQARALAAIRESMTTRGYPPSVRELGEAIGLSSTSSVKHVLDALRRKGAVLRHPSRARALAIPGESCPVCGQPTSGGLA